ncbi:hypothetical protein DL95DRAFT_397541 [Leptodontidium sp. 2 PMI_412]|nr:hypothetical protein DL95DRAFT_397541 [Leptodontidium sp. 2 PMI_412]
MSRMLGDMLILGMVLVRRVCMRLVRRRVGLVDGGLFIGGFVVVVVAMGRAMW